MKSYCSLLICHLVHNHAQKLPLLPLQIHLHRPRTAEDVHVTKATSSAADSDTSSATSPASGIRDSAKKPVNIQIGASTPNASKHPCHPTALSYEGNRLLRIRLSYNRRAPSNWTSRQTIPSPAI